MNKSESKYFNTALRMSEALIALLEEKDLEYITVKEICHQAGVNRSTFYLHYETIADLVNETLEIINQRFLSYFPQQEEDVLGNMDSREREIVILRYGLDGREALPQREVAKKLKISRSYVSRIEKKALGKLQTLFKNAEKNALYARK